MKIKFWKRKEVWGTALTILSFAPEMLGLFPQHTLAFKIATPIGLILAALGLRSGYKADNLPSGITRVMDKAPDTVTGVKGSDNLFNAEK